MYFFKTKQKSHKPSPHLTLPQVSGTSLRRYKFEFLSNQLSAVCFGVVSLGHHYGQVWCILLRSGSHTEILTSQAPYTRICCRSCSSFILGRHQECGPKPHREQMNFAGARISVRVQLIPRLCTKTGLLVRWVEGWMGRKIDESLTSFPEMVKQK